MSKRASGFLKLTDAFLFPFAAAGIYINIDHRLPGEKRQRVFTEKEMMCYNASGNGTLKIKYYNCNTDIYEMSLYFFQMHRDFCVSTV